MQYMMYVYWFEYMSFYSQSNVLPFSHFNLKKIDFKFPTFHYRSIQPNFLLFHHLLIFLFQSVQMFVAQFCDLLEVEISCDGCGATLPGRRYRCLLCQDMDLCTTCYAGQ